MTTSQPSREPPYDGAGRRGPLDVFFAPKTVALIGATEAAGSVGRRILTNLVDRSFGGTVYPVSLKRPSVLGIKAYREIGQIPEKVDLVVVATPAPAIPAVIRQCTESGVKAAIVISAGFKEVGAAGAELERQVLAEARRTGLRIIGPNCLGVMSPATGLNATFAGAMALPGSVGFISQSGALCTAILDWSLREQVGFSAFVSIGSMLDVGWGDLIDYFADDPSTHSIVIYMESIGDARSFLSAAREAALAKPIIVLKAGRSDAAARAAASHTGSLAGRDAVLEAAFRRCGVLRVHSIADLFNMAEVLAKQPRPRGPRLTILTNAGGPAVLATDALIAAGGELAPLSSETVEELNRLLPPHWSHNNPIDVLGDASPDRYSKAVEIAARDPQSDGLLAILAPQAMTDPTQTAEGLKPLARLKDRPVLASWMGGGDVEAGDSILARAGIPTFPYPDSAARAFCYMWRYSYNLRGLYETPIAADDEQSSAGRQAAESIVQAVRASGRTILTEVESKQLLAAYDIPAVPTLSARSAEEAVRLSGDIGYPVVLKLLSETITHKSDVGGVQLNLSDAGAVRRAYAAIETAVRRHAGIEQFQGVSVQPMMRREGYELILGSSVDPQFGPVLLFGAGGQLVEVLQDRALALPPLNTTLARRMMEQTRIYSALQGVRGHRPVDMAALEQLLVRFGRLVVEQRWVREIDVNPLLASAEGFLALDARVILHGQDVREQDLPTPAIRSYPAQYVAPWTMKDGVTVTIRPIRPEDEPMMVKFHEGLSDQSVYLRYFRPIQLSERVRHERLTRICFIDYDREMALVAEHRDPATGVAEISAVGRLIKLHGTNEAEWAVVVSDRFQRHRLGEELVRRLVQVGRDEKLLRITAAILPSNYAMQRVCERLDFRLSYDVNERLVKAEFIL
ncbi:MAG: bifunctional acetate--CoA ligase family protein/GNAT family N-acetyltransferase [Bryobacterales bacterium]